ncbi:hypothetical protein [Streptomyces sp. B6B3]
MTDTDDRIPAQAGSPDLPQHPDYPRILAVRVGLAMKAVPRRDV